MVSGIAWLLEIVLLGLLGGVLFQTWRLERALGVLKRDRASLEHLVAGFNASTRQAEAGIERLRGAADGAGRVLAKQTESALALKDDLTFLGERAERIADRLDNAVRRARPAVADAKPVPRAANAPAGAPANVPVVAGGMTSLMAVGTSDRLEHAVRRARASVAKTKHAAAAAKGIAAASAARAAEASAT